MTVEDLFKKISALQKQINNLAPHPTEWDADYMEKVKVDFTFASNNLEGNKVSHGQTIEILS